MILDAFFEGLHLPEIIPSSSECVEGFEDTFNFVMLAAQSASEGDYYGMVLNTTDFMGGFYPLSEVCSQSMVEFEKGWV